MIYSIKSFREHYTAHEIVLFQHVRLVCKVTRAAACSRTTYQRQSA